MKRASDDPPPCAKRGCDGLCDKRLSLVRLNVGGRCFDVSPESLSGAAFFEPLLAGRMSFAVDENARVFIDRSGKLFELVLQFLRNRCRPPQRVLDTYGEELLIESDFFGIDCLSHHIRGEISPFDLRAEDRALRRREEQARMDPKAFERELLLDVHSADMGQRSCYALQLPLLFDGAARPALSGSFSDFYERLNDWSGGLVEDLSNVPSLVFAGGSVLSALVGGMAGDLDIFLVGAEEPERCLRDVFAAVQKNQAKHTGTVKSKMLVTRSKNAVTIFRVVGPKPMGNAPPVQVITALYKSPLELLIGFDVDSSCFAFVATENRVVCTPRGQRALQHSVNIADTAHVGPSYCRRLEKYAGRGFAIAVPGYLPARASKHLRNSEYILLRKYDLLLKVEPRVPHKKKMEISVPQYNGLRAELPEIVRLSVNVTQKGSAIRNMARLVVLGRKNGVRAVETPELQLCDSHNLHSAEDARMSGACVPVGAGSRGEYLLLWGASVQETVESDMDNEGYEQTPLARVYDLLDKHFRYELEMSDETPQNDDAMWMGGAMHRLASAMAKRDPCSVATQLATEHQACRIQSSESLLFVYDFCTCNSLFESLRFVRDAGRPPLNSNLDAEHFVKIYGLQAKLLFEPHRFREPATMDWWEGVY